MAIFHFLSFVDVEFEYILEPRDFLLMKENLSFRYLKRLSINILLTLRSLASSNPVSNGRSLDNVKR